MSCQEVPIVVKINTHFTVIYIFFKLNELPFQIANIILNERWRDSVFMSFVKLTLGLPILCT